jgi:hypothetical protein
VKKVLKRRYKKEALPAQSLYFVFLGALGGLGG